ncbi:MAG TPA: 4-hydroxyphenylpyruvate dioxygenase [Solirubrobacterales bacterium]|jgi:4-hydroxyphenylpyruvate dioxygenase|nr:4-hydroxyphenylpyruvate dioxygenase [Solirubrobacterales bacterium]
MESQTVARPSETTDEMPLLGIDHIELYVGNAVQASYFFTHALGFRHSAYAGLETGVRDRASHVLEQGRIRFVLTSPLLGTSEIARHIAHHGDGVRVIGLSVPDAEHAYRHAVRHGARGVREPWEESDEGGTVRMSTIATYGDTLHTFVQRDGYEGPFLPGFGTPPDAATKDAGMLVGVDHVVGNVELGRLEEWVSYYERVFGMTEMIHFTDRDISTEYSALMSKVMADGKGRVKFPINEPAEGKRKSQIEEFLEYYGGPGAQHVALATTDIVKTVTELRNRGVRFLATPSSYYEELPERIGEIDEDLADLRELGILADRDDEGYLLQIFTATLGDRPTLFLEVIERHGARGFGEGNFKALFEAIEREQERRGNL